MNHKLIIACIVVVGFAPVLYAAESPDLKAAHDQIAALQKQSNDQNQRHAQEIAGLQRHIAELHARLADAEQRAKARVSDPKEREALIVQLQKSHAEMAWLLQENRFLRDTIKPYTLRFPELNAQLLAHDQATAKQAEQK